MRFGLTTRIGLSALTIGSFILLSLLSCIEDPSPTSPTGNTDESPDAHPVLHAYPNSGEILLQEDFESIPCGSTPSGWMSGCGNNDYGVDCSAACIGSRSLRVFGLLGSCWAGLVAKTIHPGGSYVPLFTVSLILKNGTENTTGCHPQRGSLEMKTGQCWTSDGRRLFHIQPNGDISGSYGLVAGKLDPPDQCHRIEIEYDRFTQDSVRVSYWIDGAFSASVVAPAHPWENNLTWFHWGSQEGTAWFDDIIVRTGHRIPPVLLDIMPGSCRNPVNMRPFVTDENDNSGRRGGVIPVAVIGSAEFDVTSIEPSSLLLEGIAPLKWSLEDVTMPGIHDSECGCPGEGPDGNLDMLLKFSKKALLEAVEWSPSDPVTKVSLVGSMVDGARFEATDCITILHAADDENIEVKDLR